MEISINMFNILSAVVASMLVSFTIAFPIIQLLYKFNVTMTVDFTTLIEKRNLKIGVPIMGGLIIIVTVLVLNLLFNPFKNPGLILILSVFLLSALLGGVDDVLNIYGRDRAKPRSIAKILKLIRVHKSKGKRILMIITFPWSAYKSFFYLLGSNPGKGIQAHEKILVQSIAGLSLGVGLCYFGLNGSDLSIPLTDSTIDLGIMIIPFVWITVLLMTNAVNLADGMDALAASLLLPSFLAFLIIAVDKQDERMVFLLATVLGSIITYLYFNIPPARFQMGDVGSLAMGTLLASVAFVLREPLLLLIISMPFAITLLSAVIQGLGRRILGRRIFVMAPIHYHLQLSRDWSEEKVVMRMALFAIVCAIIGLWIYFL
jgi:phospho-N-acetylmuramoyl-pentapeptide-transferase